MNLRFLKVKISRPGTVFELESHSLPLAPPHDELENPAAVGKPEQARLTAKARGRGIVAEVNDIIPET